MMVAEGGRGPFADEPADGAAPRLGFFGTFDVENYGDLLFPAIAARRLAPAGVAVVPVSPTGERTRFVDAAPQVAVERFAADDAPVAALAVGGGNIVHLRRTEVERYRAIPGDLAYPALWLGPSLLAARWGCPVVWNAPGVLVLGADEAPWGLLSRLLPAVDYLSVRDSASAALLAPFDGGPVAVVPDTALDIDLLWPRDRLDARLAELLAAHGVAGRPPLLAVHVKARSLGGIGLADLAAGLEALAQPAGLLPVLLAIGRVHGDGETARALASHLRAPAIVLDAPDRLEDIAAVIACAQAAIVASLHGFVTATAYERPAVLVAAPPLAKFAGFAGHVGRQADVAGSWPEGLARLAALGAAGWPAPPPPDAARQRLARHWERLREAIAGPVRATATPARTTLLAELAAALDAER